VSLEGFCAWTYLTSANAEGRSTMMAPPNRGVDTYVVMVSKVGFWMLWMV
jgi:hypothetical protein